MPPSFIYAFLGLNVFKYLFYQGIGLLSTLSISSTPALAAYNSPFNKLSPYSLYVIC